MPHRARTLWSLGGLSLPELLYRTTRESWEDAVFGQGGRMAFYQFLAIFPVLMIFLVLSTRVPHIAHHGTAFRELSHQLLPAQAAQLFDNVAEELSHRALSGIRLLSVCAGALWAALNGTRVMIQGLNRAYEVEEHRSLWQQAIITVGLAVYMAVASYCGLLMVLAASRFRRQFPGNVLELRALEWLVLIVLLSVSFAVLYRFAPNVHRPQWRWSTPGAMCAIILWIAATFVARVYFERVNDYTTTYGHLNGVVILLLWLYATNGAVLVGGEMNSEIEKNAQAGNAPRSRHNPAA